MNRSTIITIITAATLTLSLTACGNTIEADPVDTTPPAVSTPTPAPTPVEEEEVIEQEDAPVITEEDTVIEGDDEWDDFIEDAEGN